MDKRMFSRSASFRSQMKVALMTDGNNINNNNNESVINNNKNAFDKFDIFKLLRVSTTNKTRDYFSRSVMMTC